MKRKPGNKRERTAARRDDASRRLGEAEEILRDTAPVMEEAGLAPQTRELRGLIGTVPSAYSVEALHDAAISVTEVLDLRATVKRIVTTMIDVLGVERGVVFLGSESAGLAPVLAIGIDGEDVEHTAAPMSETILRIAQSGKSVVSADALHDAVLKTIASVSIKGIRAVLCAPLRVGSETMGVLYLDSPNARTPFSPEAERFFSIFVDVAAVAVRNAQLYGSVMDANSRLRSLSEAAGPLDLLLGKDSQMAQVRRKAILAAQLRCPVLVHGEPGTETEEFARAVAQARRDARSDFLSYGCGSDETPDRVEWLLFGGSVRRGPRGRGRAAGLVGLAAEGVLFLEEIAQLDLRLQARLAEFVAEPPGAGSRGRGSVQLIASTGRDTGGKVESGRFDKELFRRLGMFQVPIPPLRERRDDIPLLLDRFARKHAWLRADSRPIAFTEEALAELQARDWPGNVAQLESVVEKLSVRVTRSKADVASIRQVVQDPEPAVVHGAAQTLAEMEREAIRRALVSTRWNKAWAARLLGMQRNTFLRKVRKYGIALPSQDDDGGRRATPPTTSR